MRSTNPPYYLTAYGLAVKHGFKGTVEEWLESLKGEKGELGDKVEVKCQDGYIWWRWIPHYGAPEEDDETGDYEWKQLVSLEEIRGEVLDDAVGQLNRDVEQLLKDVADLKYVPIDITSVANSIGIVELGRSIPEITLTWVINKAPVSQTVEGEAVDAAARSTVLTGPFASSKTFTVTATDERGATDKATTTINFYNGVYYGAIANNAALNDAAILGLTRKLQGSKALTFTADAGAGQLIAYALPTRYGTPGFNVGGFDGGFHLAATIHFKNASGYTEPYNVWVSDNTGLGVTTVKVT